MKRQQEYFKDILNPTVIEMIPTPPPTDRCDEKKKKKWQWKDHQIQMKLKMVSKTQKMVRPQVWTILHPNCYGRILIKLNSMALVHKRRRILI
jgi:hypothetical protein